LDSIQHDKQLYFFPLKKTEFNSVERFCLKTYSCHYIGLVKSFGLQTTYF